MLKAAKPDSHSHNSLCHHVSIVPGDRVSHCMPFASPLPAPAELRAHTYSTIHIYRALYKTRILRCYADNGSQSSIKEGIWLWKNKTAVQSGLNTASKGTG